MSPTARYDCLIVGAGVTGTALLYELARFTDIKRLCLIEKYNTVARVNSNAHNNSQTIHSGDIESSYDLDKARAARRAAAMMVNYATKREPRERDRIVHRMPKILLGVGPEECAKVRQRYRALNGLYPRMRLLARRDIADLEPNVALVDGSWRPEEIVAAGSADDYAAVDFQALAESFSFACVRIDRTTDKQITQLFSTSVERIRRDGHNYVLDSNRGPLLARSVVVCAGAHSLPLAQEMGLGLQYSLLPVAGSFYFAPDALKGKVYTVQDPELPFAAIHGDHDIKERGKTRFGPTALMVPMLERHYHEPTRDLLKSLRFDRQVASALWGLVREPQTRGQVLRNFLYELPGLNRRLIIRDIRKIVPSLTASDIEYAHDLSGGFGGVRPHLIDRTAGTLVMDKTKLGDSAGLIFNVTPSPGGTSCLCSGEQDMRAVARHLGAQIDEQALADELFLGHEDVGIQESESLDEDEPMALAAAG
jgi:malate dehydrogenase (quinone)